MDIVLALGVNVVMEINKYSKLNLWMKETNSRSVGSC